MASSGQKTALKSPVAAGLVGLITFASVYSLQYFTPGMIVLIAVVSGALTYFRTNLAPVSLAAFLSLPVFWTLMGTLETLPSPSYVPVFALFLLAVTLGLSSEDWVGGFVGLWLGLALANPFVPFLVMPALVALALLRSRRSAFVAALVFLMFGVFFQSALQMGYAIPSIFQSSAALLFPTVGGIANNPAFSAIFSALLGPNWSTSFQSSPVSALFAYLPIYIAVVMFGIILVAYYGKRLARMLPMPRLSEIGIGVAIAFLGSTFVFGLGSSAIFSAFLVFVLTISWLFLKPLTGRQPHLAFTALTGLMSNSAVTQAETFSENEGIVTIERSQAKGAMDYWEKAAGVEGIKDELVKAVMLPMENKSEAKKFGVRPAKGILLYGPPGTGKTTLLRGLAAKLGVRYVEVNPGQIMTKWYGESERKMKSIFDDALANPPTILAMDEVDAVAKDRSSYTADDVTPRLLNIILMGMDDVNRSDEDVVVVATTNKPQMLDKALTRPGRFDKVMYLGPPDEKAREAIFRRYLEGKDVVAKGLDYARLAKLSERFTGADIEALVNKVLSGAFYDQVKSKEAPETVVTQKLLEDAVTSTRPSVTFSMLEEYERFRVEFQRERRIQKGWESGVPNVRFDDIGGMDDIKAELRETIELPLTQPDLMEKLKVKMAKGVLLYGPPGNGKTMLAKAVATEVAANFFVLSGADLAKSGPADAASKIKELFNVAKDNQPSVIFIDEVDQLAPDRSDPFGAAFAPVTTQLLAELDGVRELKGVMVLAATNLPERIDPALLRAGRLEKHMEIPNPDTKERREILVISTRGVKLGEDVNLDLLADKTEAFSAADLQQLVNEAKKVILREMVKGGTRDVVTMHDFDIALQSKKKSTLGEGD